MSNFYKNKINEGFALLTASIVAIASGVVFTTFFTGLYQKNWEINYKIAVYKAELNAHSGIAYLGGQKLYTREFTEAPPLDVPRQQFVRLYREGLLSQQDAENPNPETMGTVNYWGHIMQRDDGSEAGGLIAGKDHGFVIVKILMLEDRHRILIPSVFWEDCG